MKVIEVKHLTKQFGNNKGVFDLNFNIDRGTVFGFLGPNKCFRYDSIFNY